MTKPLIRKQKNATPILLFLGTILPPSENRFRHGKVEQCPGMGRLRRGFSASPANPKTFNHGWHGSHGFGKGFFIFSRAKGDFIRRFFQGFHPCNPRHPWLNRRLQKPALIRPQVADQADRHELIVADVLKFHRRVLAADQGAGRADGGNRGMGRGGPGIKSSGVA